MNRVFWKIKDKLYYYLVDKNWGVGPEYHRYVDTHQEEHINNRWKSWWLLLRLNWHYRVLRKTEPLLNIKVKNSSIKQPYIDGAESLLSKRIEPLFLAKSLMQYDVISFDIFDTLIFRPFTKPTDLFMVLGEKFSYFDFHKIRIDAEKKARSLSMEINGSREVTLKDIYNVIERETGINAEIGVKTEIDTEIDLCFANPYMKKVYDILKSQNKKIIFISDMYMTSVDLKRILNKCGYENDVENIFVSCDYSVSKGSGELFKTVKNILGNGLRYVHIGDNVNSDVISGEKNGFNTIYYKNVNDIGNKYRATFNGMSEFVGSAYGGIVNTHLHNGLKQYSPYYEYGFIYGGLYVLGYVKWIDNYVKLHNIDKILFLARDGDIYKKVIDLLPNHVNYEYVYWSRMPSIRLEAERNRHDFLERYLRHRLNDIKPMQIIDILKMLHLEALSVELLKYNLDKNQEINKNIIKKLENFFIDNWNKILNSFEKEQNAAKEYFKYLIGNSKKVAVVDLGWAGSGPMTIKWLIEDKWNLNCKVDCLLACNYSFNHTTVLAHVASNKLNSYIFNRSYNRNLYDFHCNSNNHYNNIFFELFTQSNTPTFEGFSKKDNNILFNFGFVEAENYKIMNEMHQGIIDFAKMYIIHFKKYDYLYNISGYDAYIPFRFIASFPAYYKKHFYYFKITRNIGVSSTDYEMETLGDLLEKRGF